jgi:hypothetical protein
MDINVVGAAIQHPWHGSRREFLVWAGAGLTTVMLGASRNMPVQATPRNVEDAIYREFSGANMVGWNVIFGDGNYAPPGESPVSMLDIETRHDATLSEVRANIRQRNIMAHNITYRRVKDAQAQQALDFVHSFTCDFRLPYLPAVENTEENAQTLEAGLFVWDGVSTKLDYGMAFQWGLNPYERFGEVRSSIEGVTASTWEPVGYLAPDTEWHTFTMIVDYPNQTTLLKIDDVTYTSYFVGFAKQWPAVISAGIQVEAISIFPRGTVHGALHRVEYRNWRWQWMTLQEHQLYLPSVINDYRAGYNTYLPFVTADVPVDAEPANVAQERTSTYIPFVARNE